MARRSAAEWEVMVRNWRQSGQTAEEFAASEAISASTLAWWAWKLGLSGRGRKRPSRRGREPRRPSEALQFIPVELVPSPKLTQTETPIEIVVGSHLVRVRRGFDTDALEAVLGLLAAGEQC